jgi:hypothetical protein
MTNEEITRLARMAAIDFHINNCSTDTEYEACWAAVESGSPLPDSICEESCMDEFRRAELYEETRDMAGWLEWLMKKARDE